MKSWAILTLVAVAAAAPSRPFLKLQADGTTQLQVVEDDGWRPAPIERRPEPAPAPKDDVPSLQVEEFLSIQKHIEDSLAHAAEAFQPIPIPSILEDDDDAVTEGGADTDADEPLALPKGHHLIDLSEYTIIQILNASLYYRPETDDDAAAATRTNVAGDDWAGQLGLHKLGWIVNHSVEAQKELAKKHVTLLAPDDEALTWRKHGGVKSAESGGDAEHAFGLTEELHGTKHPFYSHILNPKDSNEKDEFDASESVDDDRAAKINLIIGWIIKYHTIPEILNPWQLSNYSTIGSALHSAPNVSEPMRIRVEPGFSLFPVPHPTLNFNFYSHTRGFTIKAKNGYIHRISAPLLPPLSALNKLFLFPGLFSQTTSSVQRSDLDGSLLPPLHEEDWDDDDVAVGDPEAVWWEMIKEMKKKHTIYTLFPPTNFAWHKLGWKKNAFLNSPLSISKKIIKYVLSYHIVPDITFFTDYVDNDTTSEFLTRVETDVDVDPSWLAADEELLSSTTSSAIEPQWEKPQWPPKMPPHHPMPPHPKVNISHYELPTLLVKSGVNPNGTLHVGVVSYRKLGHGPIHRTIVVFPPAPHHAGGEEHTECPHKRPPPPKPVAVWKADVVARLGAIHPVNTLLRPPYYHHNKTLELTSKSKHGKKHHLAGLFA
ncbi:Fasciclin domain family protein [Pseudohyphozyma bogoriensis]|nr:Fasciclin domain family protein [Pseudohyphozyma bogoriensis]